MNENMLHQSYQLDPHARFRVHDGEGIFVLQEAGEVLVVNRVAALIVERLTATPDATVQDAIKEVCERFDVSADTARKDAAQLIEDLVRSGALSPR